MSETTIDTLVLDIQAPAAKAAKELQDLGNALATIKEGGKMSAAVKHLGNLRAELERFKLSSKTTSNLTQLATSLSALRDSTKGNNLKAFLNNLQRIPEVTKQIKPEVIKQFSSYMKDLAAAMGPLSTQINRISSGFSKLPGRVTQCVTAVNKMEKSSKSLGARMSGLGNVLQGFFGITFSGFAIGSYFSSAIESINSFVEITNYSTQVMGDYAKEAQDYAYQVQDALGIDASAFMEAQATFMTLGQGFGVAADKAYAMSKGLTELAYDISSFKDENPEEVFQKLQSAISGEIEPVRRWGVALDQATMKQWMLKNGIDANINSLTQADKALIRYNMVVETMSKNGAIYDLARTLESPANAIRILKQQLTQLSRAVGSVFIPILVAVIPYVQAFVKVLTGLISALARLVGFEMPDWSNSDWGAAPSIAETNEALDDATDKAKEFKKQLMGFDELNIISNPSDSSSKKKDNTGTSALDGLDVASVWKDGMLDSFKNKVDELVPKMEKLVTIIGLIGAGFAAWKIGTAIAPTLKTIFETLTMMKKIGVIPTLSFFTGEKGTLLLTRLSSLPGLFKLLPAPIKAIVAVAALLVAAFVDLWKNGETFRKTVVTVFGEVKNVFTSTWSAIWTGAIQPLLEKLGITATSVSDLYGKYVRPTLDSIASLFTTVLGITVIAVLNGFASTLKLITGVVAGIFTGDWKLAIEGLKGLFNPIPEHARKKFEELTTKSRAQLVSAKTTLSTAVGNIKTAVQSKFKSLKDNTVGYFKTMRDKGKDYMASLKEKIKSPINGIIGGVEKMANGIIKAINGMVKAFNQLSWDIPKWVPGGLGGKKFGFNLKTVSEISIPRFERGGFLEDGLFTMNRGEIAGKFNNGQSVVANNMQIISGIRSGVMEGIKSALSGDLHSIAKALTEANRVNYRVVGSNTIAQTSGDSSQLTEAVYNAISENNSKGGSFTFIVDLDGEVVAKKVFKVHNDKVIQTGSSPLLT